MDASTPPDIRYAFYAVLVTQICTLLGLIVGVVKAWLDNQVIMDQNRRQLQKQDTALAQQVVIHKQLNGATEALVAAATAAGIDKGKLAGIAGEQARLAGDASAERLEEIRGDKA